MQYYYLLFILLFPFLTYSQQEDFQLVKDIVPGFSSESGPIFSDISFSGDDLFFSGYVSNIYRYNTKTRKLLKIKNSWPIGYFYNLYYTLSDTSTSGEQYYIGSEDALTVNIWKTQQDTTFNLTKFTNSSFIHKNIISINHRLIFYNFNRTERSGSVQAIEDDSITKILSDISVSEMVRIHNTAIIFGWKDNTYQVWVTDGTINGTSLILNDLPSHSYPCITEFKGEIYIAAGTVLWKTDLTKEGTLKIADIYLTHQIETISNLTATGKSMYFTANNSVTGYELYKTDGTSEGIKLVADIYPGKDSSLPFHLTPTLNDKIYFTATDSNGTELWISDGTQKGTRMVKDIDPGINSSTPYSLVLAGGKLYFKTMLRSVICIWESDGTEKGTRMVTITDDKYNRNSSALFSIREKIYYTDSDNGYTSCFTIGDKGNPEKLFDFDFRYHQNSQPQILESKGNIQYFVEDKTLWKTTGTSETTTAIRQLDGILASNSVISEGLLYFVVLNSRRGFELWRSDGTEAGTYHIRQLLSPERNNFNYYFLLFNLCTFKNKIFIRVSSPNTSSHRSLWVSEGTYETTRELISSSSDNIAGPYTTSESLFFIKENLKGDILWTSDGTSSNTYPVRQFSNTSDDSVSLTGTVLMNNQYFLTEFNYSKKITNIWQLKNNEFELRFKGNNKVFLVGLSGNDLLLFTDKKLFRSNTTGIEELIRNDLNHLNVLGNINDKLIFSANPDNIYYYGNTGEIWVTDGTSDGTYKLDILRERDFLQVSRDTFSCCEFLYIMLNGDTWKELWKTDGTKEGTKMVIKFPIWERNHDNNQSVCNNNRIYFTYNSPEYGKELFTYLCGEEIIPDSITEFTIYPNPATDYIKIKLPQHYKDIHSVIYNTFGKKIWEGSLDNQNQINVERLASGIYILEVEIDEEKNRFTFIKI